MFVEHLKILQSVRLGRSFEPMAGLDMIHVVVVPRNVPPTPSTPATVPVVYLFPQVRIPVPRSALTSFLGEST